MEQKPNTISGDISDVPQDLKQIQVSIYGVEYSKAEIAKINCMESLKSACVFLMNAINVEGKNEWEIDKGLDYISKLERIRKKVEKNV